MKKSNEPSAAALDEMPEISEPRFRGRPGRGHHADRSVGEIVAIDADLWWIERRVLRARTSRADVQQRTRSAGRWPPMGSIVDASATMLRYAEPGGDTLDA